MPDKIPKLHACIDDLERKVAELHRQVDEIERDEAARRAIEALPDCVAAAMMADQVDEYSAV